jgi:hypothetical protein
MARKNPHIGSSFESWLDDAGIREDVTAAAIKAVIVRRLASDGRAHENQPRASQSLVRP